MSTLPQKANQGIVSGGASTSPEASWSADEGALQPGVLPGAQGVTPIRRVGLGLGLFFALFVLLFLFKLYLFAQYYKEEVANGADASQQVVPAAATSPTQP